MLEITSVEAGGYAAAMSLEPGDRLLSIDGRPLSDLVDYHQGLATQCLTLEVLRRDREVWELHIEKETEEDLGLAVEHPAPRQCGNHCLFCFVHQLPAGMRRSLYVKDEDYRFSYLYGSYVTLTNLTSEDFTRIVDQRLSPLYVSVHATNPELRRRLLGAEAPEILPLLQRLVSAGIELHCQVVLCPGLNDGAELARTLTDLSGLFPGIASLAVVPVGLTRHREKLPDLAPVDQTCATACLGQVTDFQQQMLKQFGRRFVYAADELYLRAGQDIPAIECYEDLPQLENGVGLIAVFREEQEEVLKEAEPLDLRRVTLVTGHLFAPELAAFAGRLAKRAGVELPVAAITNDFFGDQVTVAGLLTGSDLQQQLAHRDLGDGVVLPAVMFKDDTELLLDDLHSNLLSQRLGTPVIVVDETPWGLLAGLERLASQAVEVIQC